jgi:hypothetical protein
MGRDNWRFRMADQEREARKRISPTRRGIGCLLVVILGIIGYLGAGAFLDANRLNGWIYLPPELSRPPFAPWLPYNLALQAIVALLFMLFGFGLLNFLYAVMFPIRPGETDAPPPARRPRRRRK